MDLLHTTPMLTSREIKVLHLEPTDVCQAECPLCARETNKDFNKNLQHHLTTDALESLLSEEVIVNLEKVFMCGNYGDPAAGQHTMEIYKWFRERNQSIVLGMNTNGGLQNIIWWKKLAELMAQPQDYVVFSIDGLEDTNHLYRVNVNWQRVIKNAQAFISAGGSAHWDMLVYQHNEHQVDFCEKLARDMGFKWFRTKISKRPAVKGLSYPLGWKLPIKTAGPIDCHALRENSAYIDARARLHVCCWLGNQLHQDPQDFHSIESTWNTDRPEPVCQSICSKKQNGTDFINQWQKNIQLR